MDVKEEFDKVALSYSRLGKNVSKALNSFLEEEKISFVNVYYRVKEFDSFKEKIDRKSYSNPFQDIEDICGVRIICYYASDIAKIEEIIQKEFNVLDSEDKSNALGLKEFAYRSVHKIVTIKKDWTSTPNYRGLENLKMEIQIRTILMHAWAEIEHKLNYKSDAQVPIKFQRKLFRLSAKFEEADEQFEELRDGINEYRKGIITTAKEANKFDISQDLNIDSLIAFLNFHFPDIHNIEKNRIDTLFDSMIRNNMTFDELEAIIDKFSPHFKEITKDLEESGYVIEKHNLSTELLGFTFQVLKKNDHKNTILPWKKVVEKWIKKLNKSYRADL